MAADGRQCLVTSLWARKLTVVDFIRKDQDEKRPAIKHSIELPFAPRLQLPIPKTDKVIVADAFGGKLAVVDVVKGMVDLGKNIARSSNSRTGVEWRWRKAVPDPPGLHANAHTSHPDIHWGNLMVNYLRSLSRAALLKPDADLLTGSRLFPLGEPDHGTGDPAAVAVAGDGRIIVTLAGVGEVAIGTEKKDWSYLEWSLPRP